MENMHTDVRVQGVNLQHIGPLDPLSHLALVLRGP